jgi:hypothetical protein
VVLVRKVFSGVLVSKNLAAVVTLEAAAVTVYLPAVPLAVKVVAVATPEVLVVVVYVAVAFANVPLAPEAGAVKVTLTPGTGLPARLITVAANAVAKGVLRAVLCGVPAVAVITAAPEDTSRFTAEPG